MIVNSAETNSIIEVHFLTRVLEMQVFVVRTQPAYESKPPFSVIFSVGLRSMLDPSLSNTIVSYRDGYIALFSSTIYDTFHVPYPS
jgi:hypothetical protein